MADKPGTTPPGDELEDDENDDQEEAPHIEVIENLMQKIDNGSQPTDNEMRALQVAQARLMLDLVSVIAELTAHVSQIRIGLKKRA